MTPNLAQAPYDETQAAFHHLWDSGGGLTMRVDSELENATILDLRGTAIRFGELYARRPTLVVFVRHFGCIFCRERYTDLSACAALLDAHGMNAVVIGNGTVPMAEAFGDTVGSDIPLYTDPSRAVFKLAGMKRMFGLNLATIGHGLRSWKAGHRQTAVAGDVWQQGGCLVIDTNGDILAAQHDASAGDHIDFEALITQATLAA